MPARGRGDEESEAFVLVNELLLGHKPETMRELYSKLSRNVEFRLKESERVGLGFDVRPMLALSPPSAQKLRSDTGQVRSPGSSVIEAMKKRLRAGGEK